jgi:hypothetical protein
VKKVNVGLTTTTWISGPIVTGALTMISGSIANIERQRPDHRRPRPGTGAAAIRPVLQNDQTFSCWHDKVGSFELHDSCWHESGNYPGRPAAGGQDGPAKSVLTCDKWHRLGGAIVIESNTTDIKHPNCLCLFVPTERSIRDTISKIAHHNECFCVQRFSVPFSKKMANFLGIFLHPFSCGYFPATAT